MARSNKTCKRGQVEWAIWRFFNLSKSAPADPPQVFLTRAKRLLETDRHDKVPAGQQRPPVPYAFSSGEPEGQGVDAAFTPFDAFCLALALDLVDFGFKPSEIVFLLRYLRPVLEGTFQTILREPPPPIRQRPVTKGYSRYRRANTDLPWRTRFLRKKPRAKVSMRPSRPSTRFVWP